MKFQYSRLLKKLPDEFVYKDQVDLGDSMLWALINNKPVGYICYLISGIEINILYIEVLKDYKRKGIARKLVQRLIEDFGTPETKVSVMPGSYEGSVMFKNLVESGILPKNTLVGG